MNQRLDLPYGLSIDRDRPLWFTLDGRRHPGYQGDTLASALLAEGQWILNHSPWYRRPRGIYHLDAQDHHCPIQLTDGQLVPAPAIPLQAGMSFQTPPGFGSPNWWQKLINRFKSLPAVPFWERPHLASALAATPTASEIHHTDVAVIGGGAAGMVAALAVAETGSRVVLVEQESALGGALRYGRFDAEGERGQALANELQAQLEQAHVQVLTDTICVGRDHQGLRLQRHAAAPIQLVAPRVILATGASGEMAVFGNNDLPGIVHGSAAQRLIRLYGVRPGQQAVVLTANGEGYGVALDLLEAGVTVTALVDMMPEAPDDIRALTLSSSEVEILHGWQPVQAHARRGHLASIEISDGSGTTRQLACDLLCVEVGAHPRSTLIREHGGSLVYDEEQRNLVIEALPEEVSAVGALKGTWDLDTVLLEARFSGWQAAGRQGSMVVPGAWQQPINHPWPIFPHAMGFVDLSDELTTTDMDIASGADPTTIHLLDRLVTPENLNSLRLACQHSDTPIPGFRLPALQTAAFPTSSDSAVTAHMAATDIAPEATREDVTGNVTAHTTDNATESVAVANPVLETQAAQHTEAPSADTHDASVSVDLATQIQTVRERVALGLLDHLGGLEIRGPQAAECLAAVLRCAVQRQAVGTIRHVILTDAQNQALVEGLLSRFAREFFYLSSRLADLDLLHQHLQAYQQQHTLDLELTDVSQHLTRIEIVGPQSREFLAPLCQGVVISREGMPFMSARRATVADIPVRLLRSGYMGELSHEIHVAKDQAESLLAALDTAGPLPRFSQEARELMALEKGHPWIGKDTVGLVMSGRRNGRLYFHDPADPDKHLLNFIVNGDTQSAPPVPGHALSLDGETVGAVVRAAFSPTLGNIIGFAKVAISDINLETAQLSLGEDYPRVKLDRSLLHDPGGLRQLR